MDQQYLGDSYDVVKRFLRQVLDPIAPLYSYDKFVPDEMQSSYTLVTGIPILAGTPEGRFGVLLDPDTGVPLPTEGSDAATKRHAPLQFIITLEKRLHPEYMICFDQSYHRKHELTRQAQREAKRDFLRAHGLSSFYYVSHAPFVFVAVKPDTLHAIFDRLILVGIPSCRFEGAETLH